MRTWKSLKLSKKQNGIINMKKDASRIGDISELTVIAHYLSTGWEVFRNQGSTGPIDIILFNRETSEIKLIDVKTTRKYGNGNRKSWGLTTPTDEQIKLGIELIFYSPEENRIGTRNDFPTTGESDATPSKVVKIGKKTYYSITAASAGLNVSTQTVANRVKSDKWPDWNIVE